MPRHGHAFRSRYALAGVAVVGLTGAAATTAVAAAPANARVTNARRVTNTKINVGVLPIADVAPLYLGMKMGFFAKQHLTVVPHQLQGGAAVASAVIGHSLDFGFGATANLLLARASHLPLVTVANGDAAATTAASAWSGILVSAKSPITSIADLAGKTIAANALRGENELALDDILLKNHVNPSSVHVVALGFPDMPAALQAGSVAAVTEVEPFVAAIKATGGRLISPLFEGADPAMTVATYFTTASEIASHRALVASFAKAMEQSLAYASSHSAAVRAIIPTYTKIPAKAASVMPLPLWGAAINVGSITFQERLMRRLGWLTSDVNVGQSIWSGAAR